MLTRRVLLWVATVTLGLVATLMTSFGAGPAAVPLLAVALIVMVRTDKLIALSGLLVGFGASWLILLAGQATSADASDESIMVPIAVGAVALPLGLLALMPGAARSAGRRLGR